MVFGRFRGGLVQAGARFKEGSGGKVQGRLRVRGGFEVRFHEGSTRVRKGPAKAPHAVGNLGISPELIFAAGGMLLFGEGPAKGPAKFGQPCVC